MDWGDAERTAFLKWWEETGRFLDPDTSDVPFEDKVEEIAYRAFQAGGWFVANAHKDSPQKS
jgi:hypothetical protein